MSIVSLKLNKCNMPQILPLTEDLVLLSNYMKVNIQKLTQMLRVNPSYDVHRELSEYVMTQSLVLNKRRGSETSMLLTTTYTERPDWKQATCMEIMMSFSTMEQKSLDT